MAETYRCRLCNKEKARRHFYIRKESGLPRTECKPCTYKSQDPRKRQRASLRFRYGITLEQYDEMVMLQCGTCVLCGSDNDGKKLCVDHCHDSGKVRGLLCDSCNLGIGRLHDDPELCRKAARYLEGAY